MIPSMAEEHPEIDLANPDSYVEVQSVRPSVRVGPDGFVLHETVAEYVQILTLQADELR